MSDLHRGQGFVAAVLDLFLAQAQLERPKGHVVQNRRAEQLNVRILEDQTHLAVEAESVFALGNGGYVSTESPHGSAGRALDSVEQLEQRRLPAAVRAQQDDPLAGPYLEINAV
jgi:hypothetical protein